MAGVLRKLLRFAYTRKLEATLIAIDKKSTLDPEWLQARVLFVYVDLYTWQR